jgi:hypothetical protein
MKALSYLLHTQLKNRILSFKKKPAMLILYSIIAVVIIASMVMMIMSGEDFASKKFADERILFSIIAGLGLLFLYAFMNAGLSTGSSLFTMPDIGLLFVAPISSKKILMYGLISTLGKALLGSLFIFYQIGTLRTSFGYGFLEIFSLFIIFAVMIMYCQLMAIGIYIFSNGNLVRKNIVKLAVYACLGVILLMVVIFQRQNDISMLEAILRVASSRGFSFIPVAGWSTMFFIGITGRSLAFVLIPLFLYCLTGAIIVIYLTMGKADYYEDVLLSTEVTYQTKLAAKEGRKAPNVNKKKIKINKEEDGLKNGNGAMVFLYKHMLEMRRRSRFIFLDSFSIFMILSIGAAGYYLNSKGIQARTCYYVLGTAIYIQYFATVMGKLKEELTKPYIYLVPEKSYKKVLAASLTSLIKPCLDGTVMFTIFTVLSGINPLTGLFLILAYASSGAVFTALTILYQRLLGGQPNKVVQAFLGIGLFLTIMSPAIGASVVAAYLLPYELQFLCSLPYTLFCILFAVLIFVLCRNLIDKAEYTGKF